MKRVRVDDHHLMVDVMGDEADPAVVLIVGTGRQLLFWDGGFCDELVHRRMRVVRFDNRDAGESDGFSPKVDLSAVIRAARAHEPIDVPYTLDDMASDVIGLMDALEIGRATLVGHSLGGMVAQQAAVHHPERLDGLVSFSSTTGSGRVGQATREAARALFSAPPPDREEAIESRVEAWRVIGSPGHFDEAAARERAARAFDRGFRPDGAGRQLAGSFALGNRTKQLGSISVPTLVIHGAIDPLIDVSGGKATAEAIPGARLVVIGDLAHDLPEPLWPEIAGHIAGFVHEVRTG